MKNTSPSPENSAAKSGNPQEAKSPSLVEIAKLLNLSPRQTMALAVLADFEGESPANYCKVAVLSFLQPSFDLVEIAARENGYEPGIGEFSPKQTAYAKRILAPARALFELDLETEPSPAAN